jgi:carboxypeptidase family protein
MPKREQRSRAVTDFCWPCAALLLAISIAPQTANGRQAKSGEAPHPEPLKLVVVVEQPMITEPFPARATLLLHNTGKEPLWLYRRARAPRPPIEHLEEENRGPETTGGSTLTVKLDAVGETASQAPATPAHGLVLESVGLPRPKLVRLRPSEDYEEKATLRLAPALDQEQKPLWGRYRLTLLYQASYSNAEDLHRILGITLWQGQVASDPVEVELRSAPNTAQGSVAGSVVTPDARLITGARVSLSDGQERLLDQEVTDAEGRFSFTHLPLGLYWLTARREGATEDSAMFQHAELTSAQPAVAAQLVMLPTEIYDARKVLHKPVVFLVTDSGGRPLAKVGLEIAWSNGPVLDNVKGETGDDGIAALELIPGRNFVTLKRRGCPKQEERADVAGGEGIDGFKLVSDCAKQ